MYMYTIKLKFACSTNFKLDGPEGRQVLKLNYEIFFQPAFPQTQLPFLSTYKTLRELHERIRGS